MSNDMYNRAFVMNIDQLPNESSLSNNNILRHRAQNDFRQQINRLAIDFDTLKGADDQESIDIYITLLKRLVEGGLLLIADYDQNDELRESCEETAVLIIQSNEVN